jgi:gamma-glutamyltranspeptidase/glutathione hydrolase
MKTPARIAGQLLVAALIAPACNAQVPAKGVAGVSAANPYAVDAGLSTLGAGGNAIDAAVSVMAMLGLVEPQSSGLGGGGFLMYYDAKIGKITMLDGRETAPKGATPDMLIGPDGNPLPFSEAVISGRATGVPGVMAMLGVAHSRFGKLPWNRLFKPAEIAADSGWVVARRLGRFANGSSTQARVGDVRVLYSKPGGEIAKQGDTIRNRPYAATLRQLASRGPRALNEGPLAEAIVARLRRDPLPSSMTLEDLAGYQPVERTPICRPFLGYTVCVPPPPSSGVAVLQLLGMLEHTDIAKRGPDDPQAWFLFAEASRIMYADRDQYVADPAFVNVPVEGLLDPAYIAERAKLIGERAGEAPAAGTPPGSIRTADATNEASGTTHFVIIDAEGNVVSMTATVESVFGSGRAVEGFFLNNELTDFSFQPVVDGKPVANAVAPGKRPRSSMLPTIVLDREGKVVAALGSPGGSSIPAYNAKVLLATLAWKMSMQDAIDLPNIYARGSNFAGEASKLSKRVAEGLAERGIVVKPGEGEDSGLHGFIIRSGRLDGGADPRRDGVWKTAAPAVR